MKIVKVTFILIFAAILAGCGRSKPSIFYVLNPISCINHQKGVSFSELKIGINPIQIPSYIEKPQISLHCNQHQVHLEENHQWAGSLKDNLMRVLQANLSTLLPGAIVATSPWYSPFSPNYILQVTVSQFQVDASGKSVFRAEYLIYRNNEVIKKGQICYHKQLPLVTPATIVIAMNDNITLLSREITRTFKKEL